MIYAVLYFGWAIVCMIQTGLSIGTAYRLTKRGGDNGVALWGWLCLLELASMIPGLGVYLWLKYREE